ncbi:hypothetical protein FACS1894169_12510 [Bacteroidia bacterium]|nr:hypothetical protein FACS1894169_12510 [Bacteroidia bacterium]
MKKKIILNILVFIFTLPVFCQFGIKGGVNLSTLTNYTSASYRFGGHIGLTFEKRLSDKWYFQPELLLSSSGANFGDISSVIKGGHVQGKRIKFLLLIPE